MGAVKASASGGDSPTAEAHESTLAQHDGGANEQKQEDAPQRAEKRPTAGGTAITLVTAIVGASILSIGSVFARLQVFLVTIDLVLSFVVALIAIWWVLEGCLYTKSPTFRHLCCNVCGKKFGIIVDALLIFTNYGYLTAYNIITGQAVMGVIQSYAPSLVAGHEKLASTLIKIIIMACIMFPLSLLKSLKQLSKIASVSIFFVIATVLTVFVYWIISLVRKGQICPTQPAEGDAGVHTQPWHPWPRANARLHAGPEAMSIFLLIGYMPFFQGCYMTQPASPPLMDSLQAPLVLKLKIMKKATLIAFIICTIFYCLVGYPGVLMFGDSMPSNILTAFAPCNDIWITIISILYSMSVCIAYPIILFTLKASLMDYAKADVNTRKGFAIYAGLSLGFAVLCCALACLYENITSIFGLFTSICGVLVFFGIPIYIGLKLPMLRAESQLTQDDNFQVDSEGFVNVDPVSVGVMAMLMPGLAGESVSRARSLSKAVHKPESVIADVRADAEGGIIPRRNTVSFAAPRRYSVFLEPGVPRDAALPPRVMVRSSVTAATMRSADGILPSGASRRPSMLRKFSSGTPTVESPPRRANSILWTEATRRAASMAPLSHTATIEEEPSIEEEPEPDTSTTQGAHLRPANPGQHGPEESSSSSTDDNTLPVSVEQPKGKKTKAQKERMGRRGRKERDRGTTVQTDGPLVGSLATSGQELGVVHPDFNLPEINKQAELAKMTKARKGGFWFLIALFSAICVVGLVMNILDFAGLLTATEVPDDQSDEILMQN